MRIALLLVGFGHAARRFVHLLEESRAALAAEDLDPVIVGIVTKRHGALWDWAGLDAARAARRVVEGGALGPAAAPSTLEWITRLRTQSAETRVLVETTTLDVQSGEPAIAHVRAAFAAGAHVITANKGPAAFAYRALTQEAADAGVSFLFEGAVMDGIPIFSFARETLAGVTIRGFRGVVNSTTHHIVTALERGESFDAALARMQAEGVAEANPSLDLDGWDAAAKTSALANVWLNADLTPQLVERETLDSDMVSRVQAALSRNRRLKPVASAERGPDGVLARVRYEELELDDPLAALDGQGNALELDTWPLGRIVVTQRDGGLEKTAWALVGDLITICRRVRAGR